MPPVGLTVGDVTVTLLVNNEKVYDVVMNTLICSNNNNNNNNNNKFISYGANSTSKAPRPTYSSSGKSSTVSQKRPQTEHCYGQHRAICSRHAVQQQQRNGRRRTCSF